MTRATGVGIGALSFSAGLFTAIVIAFATGSPNQTRPDERWLQQMNARFDAVDRAVSELAQTPRDREPTLAREVRMLRDQLGEALASTHLEQDRKRADVAERERLASPENAEAYGAARNTVDAGVASGCWSEQDAADLRDSLPHLTMKQQEELLSTLIPAMNRGEIEVEFDGFPF